MLGLINRILHDLSSGITAIEKWALKLIYAVYSFVNKLFAELRKAVDNVWTALTNFAKAILKFASQVYTYAKWIVTKLVPSVIHWAEKELLSVAHDIADLGKWAVGWIDRLIKDIASAIKNITNWVIKNIFDPLKTDFLTAWHWITHEGAMIYDLITHPEKLAALLAGYIWDSWLGLFKKYGPQIARWLMRNLPNEAGMIVDAVEKFISNLL